MTDPGPDAEFEPFLPDAERSMPRASPDPQTTQGVIYTWLRDSFHTAVPVHDAIVYSADLLERLRRHYIAHYELGEALGERLAADDAIAAQQAYQRGYEDGRNAETGWRGSVQEQALRRPASAPEFADKQYERLMETTGVGGASSIDWSPGGALYEEARQNALARLKMRTETCEDCLNGIKHAHYEAP
jgi:hypothetical protein